MKSINPKVIAAARRKKKQWNVADLLDGIRRGDRILLSQAITLIESTIPQHQIQAQELIEACLPFAGNSIRVGITGTPGVGKSTFIESLGTYLSKDNKVAVLAIDPSSQQSGGSILGDKTRMEKLAANDRVFIRPSPTSDTLGGVARKTRETIILCEAAGFDTILIETVGVGQSETMVHSMVDFFMLLLLPGAGDELQGIKRGIMEMADLVLINKADGDRLKLAKQSQKDFRNALHLFPLKASKWSPKVAISSGLNDEGVEEAWRYVVDYQSIMQQSGYFPFNRSQQARYWMKHTIQEKLVQNFYQNKAVDKAYAEIEQRVSTGQLSSFKAADILLEMYKHEK